MTKFLLLLCAAGLAGAAAHAQPATTTPPAATAPAPLPEAQRQAALDFLAAIQIKQQMERQIEKIVEAQAAAQVQLAGNPPEAKAAQVAAMEQMRSFYQKAMSWEVVREDLVQAYGTTFTTTELKDLTAFYRSDLGQVYLRKQPEAGKLVAAATQRRTLALMPEMQRIMQAQQKWNDIQKATPKMPGQ
ncbi:DUF2059 domain-containing protein [Hymenobacter caeli]|uniref:DUF2059 domain-containing protein n=2 Tax=Hymenobacter caeli TaxID=2735894 RepID=A0ABX2FSV8_9BACT|nr:DUF2059 domain-containing protein [Hymenobacter caeli]NRT20047.1 hypothetical protein [Hymenobacter caeli]